MCTCFTSHLTEEVDSKYALKFPVDDMVYKTPFAQYNRQAYQSHWALVAANGRHHKLYLLGRLTHQSGGRGEKGRLYFPL